MASAAYSELSAGEVDVADAARVEELRVALLTGVGGVNGDEVAILTEGGRSLLEAPTLRRYLRARGGRIPAAAKMVWATARYRSSFGVLGGEGGQLTMWFFANLS